MSVTTPAPTLPAPRSAEVRYHRVDSPIGPLLLTGDGEHLTGVYMSEHRHGRAQEAAWHADPGAFTEACAQLAAYFAGELRTFDLPVRLVGTPFQQAVWAALRTIPYGEVRSYGAIAAAVGNPRASRAVGLANGRNPVSIVVPCHRVVGASGSLVGYGGGLARKETLLGLERRVLDGGPAAR